MIQIIWEFNVKPEFVTAFSETYGPDGPWVELFRSHAGFVSTSLLTPASGHRFFTIDRWQSEAHFTAMHNAARADYERIDGLAAEWTKSEKRLGVFRSDRRFILVSGLPGAGKTFVASRIAPLLMLPIIDKDDLLEALFEARDSGVINLPTRRALSRASDELMKRAAIVSDGAILSSFWHVQGMMRDSGTPTAWVPEISTNVVNLHCVCPADLAAQRFVERTRHPGHGDDARTAEDIKKEFRTLEMLGPPQCGPRIDVDTAGPIQAEVVTKAVENALAAL